MKEIGHGRYLETMVFECGPECECGCGMPTHRGSEVVCVGYKTRHQANEGHLKICRQYSVL